MSLPEMRIPIKYLTVVGVFCCLSVHLAHGASILQKLQWMSRSRRQPSDATTASQTCQLDSGIHRQLLAIETDIQIIFAQFILDGPSVDLMDTTSCFPSIESSAGINGEWIAARVEQIRQFMPWYREIDSHSTHPQSVLQAGFYPAFHALINMVNSTIDRLEHRMELLINQTSCGCPASLRTVSAVLTESCHVQPPPEVIVLGSFRRDVASVIRLLLRIVNDLSARRVQRPVC